MLNTYNKITTRDDCIEVINKLPDAFINQFAKLAYYYLGFTSSITEQTVNDRGKFINETANAISMINKFITLSSNGKAIDEQMDYNNSMEEESLSKAELYYSIKTVNKAVASLKRKNKSAKDIIKSELDLWGIDSNTYAYKALLHLPDSCKSTYTTHEAISAIAKYNNKNTGVTTHSIKCLIEKADFSKTEYFIALKDANNPTVDFFIEQLLNGVFNNKK